MYWRNIQSRIVDACADTPVVFIGGARQCGKSTLARDLVEDGTLERYVTLDNATVLAAATADPAGFLAGLPHRTVLDEVQRAPGLFLAIKELVDLDRQPGRFALTGSAGLMVLPRLADALVGRMEVISLWPLSQGELRSAREGFVDAVFTDQMPAMDATALPRTEAITLLLTGGYPEVIARTSARRRRAWFGAYLSTIFQREVRDLAAIERLAELPRLLALVAARSGGLCNYAELSRSTQLPQSSLKRYLALLEGVFLIGRLRAWSSNPSKRLVRSAKLYVVDSGLLAHLDGLTPDRLASDPGHIGPLLESFVVAELRKQIGWAEAPVSMFHYRTHGGHEVDVVLEDLAGRLVGIEIKAHSTLRARDFAGLRHLAETEPDRFHRGVVIHLGQETVAFGEKLHALPLDALWRLGASVR